MDQDGGSNLELGLKLNLLSPLMSQLDTSSCAAESSWSSSCGSSEADEGGGGAGEAKSMVVVGCPNCLMYIIMSLEGKPRCPRCNSKVLLDFLGQNNVKKINKRSNKNAKP